MATSIQTAIPFLFYSALLLTAANARFPSPNKGTSFSYDFNGVKPTGLTYQGDAYFPSDTTNLRLTKTDDYGTPQPYSIGRVLYTEPVQFWDKNKQADFETTLKFIIKPVNGDYNPADGLVFFIAPVGSTPDASGSSFGVFDSSGKNPSVFAVEFDIYLNDDDPSYRHVGIDVGSHVSSSVTEVDDSILWQEVTAHISYVAATKVISVHGSAGSKTFNVSYVYDLSTMLPQQVQVGISATTGMCVAVHDVIAWSFSSNLVHARA